MIYTENRNWIHKNDVAKYIGYENVKKGLQRYNSGKIETYRSKVINGKTYLSFEDLPETAQKKIPLTRLQETINENNQNKQVAAYENIIRGLCREYQAVYNQIKDRYPLAPERCTELAQTWTVWQWITEKCHKGNTNFKHLHEAYVNVFPAHLTNYKSFSNYKKSCIEKGIETTVIDRRLFGTAQRRISDAQYLFIRAMYMDDRKFTSSQVYSKLVTYCNEIQETPCSKETIKNYMYEVFEKDAECYAARYGNDALKKRAPYASLLPADYIHDQWQGDGWDVPLWIEGYKRLKVFPFIDNHSRKIIGYSIGKSENTVLIVEALEDAMRNTGVLPAEFVFDKHSYHKTDIAKRFRSETEKRGIIWTISTNPQRKAIVERYFQFLDAYIKVNYTQYLGQGITAKNKNARRNPETYIELRKPENILTETEVKAIIVDTIIQYNSTPLEVIGNISPNEKYVQSTAKHSISISENERISLIKPPAIYKVSRGQINIKQGIIKHEFQLPAHLHYLEGEKVQVIYEELEQSIYLFDIKTGECLGEVIPKPKIHGAIVNQTERDRELLNQLKGRTTGIQKQSSKIGISIANKMLIEAPETIEYIASHTISKDIRASMQENRELQNRARDLGVQENMLPIRKQSISVPVIPRPKSKAKDANSPFVPDNHTPAVFDINKFLNSENEL